MDYLLTIRTRFSQLDDIAARTEALDRLFELGLLVPPEGTEYKLQRLEKNAPPVAISLDTDKEKQ